MKLHPAGKAQASFALRLLFVCAVAVALVALPLLSNAKPVGASLTIVNNSSLDINNVYLSPADHDEWGANQLNNTVIHPGGSYTLSDLSCSQGTIKVIAEDQNGCFLSQVVSCTASSTWTITNDANPNCGN